MSLSNYSTLQLQIQHLSITRATRRPHYFYARRRRKRNQYAGTVRVLHDIDDNQSNQPTPWIPVRSSPITTCLTCAMKASQTSHLNTQNVLARNTCTSGILLAVISSKNSLSAQEPIKNYNTGTILATTHQEKSNR